MTRMTIISFAAKIIASKFLSSTGTIRCISRHDSLCHLSQQRAQVLAVISVPRAQTIAVVQFVAVDTARRCARQDVRAICVIPAIHALELYGVKMAAKLYSKKCTTNTLSSQDFALRHATYNQPKGQQPVILGCICFALLLRRLFAWKTVLTF